jgi:hypothetical protein
VCSVGLLGVEFLLKVVQWGDMLLDDRYKTVSYATQYTVLTVRSLGTGPMAPFIALTERCTRSDKLDDESSWTDKARDQKYGKVYDEKIERYARNNAADLAEKGVDLSHCTKLTNQALWSVAYYLDKERLVDDASTEEKAPETAPENASAKMLNVAQSSSGTNESPEEKCTPWRKGTSCIKELNMARCKKIDDEGLKPFADKKLQIAEVDLRDCELITKVTAAKLIADCGVEGARMKLPLDVHKEVIKILDGKDLDEAEGKLRLFLSAQPAASQCTIPHLEAGNETATGDAMEKAVLDMTFLALERLANLTADGLHLHPAQILTTIDLTSQHDNQLKERTWMTDNRYGILLSTKELYTNVTNLILSDSNLKPAIDVVANLLPQWTKLKGLDVSNNKLEAAGAKALAPALKELGYVLCFDVLQLALP